MPLAFKRAKDTISVGDKPTTVPIKKKSQDLKTVAANEHIAAPTRKSSKELINAIWRLQFNDLLPAHFHLMARSMDIRARVSDGYFFPRAIDDIIRYIGNDSAEPAIKNVLHRLGYDGLRPVQLACFEPILHRKPCLCLSRTASGKTFAYLLPLLLREGFLNTTQATSSQTLILCPTRILCEQVADVARICLAALLESCPHFKSYIICSVHSGQSQSHVNTSLVLANMLIATPGILVSKHYTFTGSVIVLDEYDDLLGGSFLEDVRRILRIANEPRSVPITAFNDLTKGICVMRAPSKELSMDRMVQFICVSATMTDEALAQAESLAFALSGSPLSLIVHGSINKIPPNIQHTYLLSNQMDTSAGIEEKPVNRSSKATIFGKITSIWHLKQLVEDRVVRNESELIEAVSSGTFYSKCIVFFLLRSQIDEDSKKRQRGRNIFRLHGEMQQEIRDEIIKRFSEAPAYSGAVLFTTDLGARGLDSKDVDLVVSIGLPSTTLSFVHRVGRAGRMGQKSLAVTVISRQTDLLKQIDDCFEASVFE